MANKRSTFTPSACLMPIVMEIQDVVLKVKAGGPGSYQEKTVTPSNEQQIVTPDENYAALSRVIVKAVQKEYGRISYNAKEGITVS